MPADFLRLIFNPIVRIKKEEWPKTLLMFLYFFLTITSYYILKPVRDSVFIDKYGAENLPYVWLITVVVLSAVVAVYVKFVDLLQKNVLLSSTVIFFVSNLVGFWWLSHFEFRWIAAVFFVWVSIFSVMMVTQFWLYANDLFNPREAKRLYGFVGSGGILGGITGGVITHYLATVVGTRHLLLVAAFILLFCALVINILWEMEGGKGFLEADLQQAQSPEKVRNTSKCIRLIWEKRYLLLLVGLVCVAKIVSTLVDYQFKNIVQAQIAGLDQRTAFFGKFFAWLNTVSFIVQFFLTSFILRRFGVGVALVLLPAGLAFGSVGILIHPGLWSAVLTAIYDGSMNYSLNQSTKEVLYLPIFREIRYRVKPFIDMVGYRLAKGIGSVLILFFGKILHFDVRSLSAIALGLIGFWFLMIKIMRKEYVNALREFLRVDLPEEHEKIVARSEAWLLYGLLKNSARGGEGNTLCAIRLYNLASELSFVTLFSGPDPLPGDVLKRKLTDYLEAGKEANLRKEIRVFLETAGLEEAGQAIRFFGEFEKDNTLILRPYLDADDFRVRTASACALILFGQDGDRDAQARAVLETSCGGEDVNLPKVADHLLASCGVHESAARETLLKMLKGLTSSVREGAVETADLKESLPRHHWIHSVLGKLVEEKWASSEMRRRLPVLLSSLENREALPLLFRMLSDRDGLARDEAIHALVRVKARAPERSLEHEIIQREIEKEIASAFLAQHLIELDKDKGRLPGGVTAEGQPDENAFLAAQEKRFHEAVTRIFLLLSLLAEPQDIRMIYHALKHPSEHIKANALELLEHIIEQPRLKRAILTLIDAEFAPLKHPSLGRWLKPANSNDQEKPLSLEELFEREDAWSFLSAVYLILSHRVESLYPRFTVLSSSANSLVQSIARVVSHKLEEHSGARNGISC